MRFGQYLAVAVLFLSVVTAHAQDSLFAPAVNNGVGDYPRSVFSADLDGDSDNDLAVANWGSDDVSILMNLTNTPAPKYVMVIPDTLYFTAVEGGSNPDADTFNVSETGGGTIAFTLAESSGRFDLDKAGGTTPEDVEVSIDISGLTADTYFDSVTVSSGEADNSPQYAFIGLEITGFCSEGCITLDSVAGLYAPDTILTCEPITFYLRLTNNSGENIISSINAFRVYSSDSATWSPITWDTTNVGWGSMYDGGFHFIPGSVNGSGADTIVFGGYAVDQPGIPSGFDSVVFLISTEVNSLQQGKTICLDSTWYPPGGEWLWAAETTEIIPDWDGPHCFHIVNIDSDGDGVGDGCDNCTVVFNPSQEDVDADSVGDSCDNCIYVHNPGQADTDGDNIGDSCDTCTDTDGDGFGNPGYPANTCAVDNCPDTANPGQADTDGDGVGDACCCVMRGSVDHSGGISVADLTYLVNYLFKGGDMPPCPEEGNVNGEGSLNVSDLTYLVSYLFKGGPAPAACP